MRRLRFFCLLLFSLTLLHGFLFNPLEASASVELEILFHRGIQQYLHGDYGQAKHLMAQATVLEPSNASYHLALGLCHLALQEYEQARRACREALTLDPALQQGQLYLGISHYFLGEYQEAKEALARAQRQNPKDGLARYYQALCAIQLDRPGEALNALAEGTRLSPELAEHFRPLEHLALVPKDVRPKKFRLEALAGAEYDSNVPLIPRQFLYVNTRKGNTHVDWAGRVAGRMEYYPYLKQDLSLGLRWQGFYNHHTWHDNWNWLDNRIDALLNIKKGPILIQPRVALDYTRYSGDNYSFFQMYGLTMNWPETNWLRGEITYQAIRKKFYYGSDLEFVRSGWEHQVGFFQGILVRQLGVIRLGGIYERDLADGKFIAAKAFRGVLQVVAFLPWELVGWVEFEFAYVDFDNHVDWARQDRLDRFFQVQLLVKKPLTPNLSLWLGFAQTYNKSTLDSYYYKRTYVPFFLSYTFY